MQLTYFFKGVFFILKHHAVGLVYGVLDSVLLAEQVEELGGAELVPPLVRSRAEAQTQDKDETRSRHQRGQGACNQPCAHTHSIIHPSCLRWAPLCSFIMTGDLHFTERETEAQDNRTCLNTYTQNWNFDDSNFQI